MGVERQIALFDSKSKQVSGKLEHKLQAVLPLLCWYFFNLNENLKGSEKKKKSFVLSI